MFSCVCVLPATHGGWIVGISLSWTSTRVIKEIVSDGLTRIHMMRNKRYMHYYYLPQQQQVQMGVGPYRYIRILLLYARIITVWIGITDYCFSIKL